MIISPESPRFIIKHRQTECSKFDRLHARTLFHRRWKTFYSTLFRPGKKTDGWLHPRLPRAPMLPPPAYVTIHVIPLKAHSIHISW